LTKDLRLGAIVLTLLDARWKAKRNVDKAMIALGRLHIQKRLGETGPTGETGPF
jgi:hypothetical protein